ncbi:MAG: HEAT repeat domain-containing protein, partial [bacterium]|nr:HEAT repeat domain-containing protein [bacterium]
MAVDGRRLEWKRGVSCWFWMILLCAGVWGCGVGQGEISEVEGEAREVLLALLEDRNVDAPLAAEAALMLGKLSELDVVPALVAALAHPEELVVVHAARALGNLGGDRAIAALDSLFQHAESTTLKIETAVILDKLGQAGKRTWLLETLETAPLGIFRSTAAGA